MYQRDKRVDDAKLRDIYESRRWLFIRIASSARTQSIGSARATVDIAGFYIDAQTNTNRFISVTAPGAQISGVIYKRHIDTLSNLRRAFFRAATMRIIDATNRRRAT